MKSLTILILAAILSAALTAPNRPIPLFGTHGPHQPHQAVPRPEVHPSPWWQSDIAGAWLRRRRDDDDDNDDLHDDLDDDDVMWAAHGPQRMVRAYLSDNDRDDLHSDVDDDDVWYGAARPSPLIHSAMATATHGHQPGAPLLPYQSLSYPAAPAFPQPMAPAPITWYTGNNPVLPPLPVYAHGTPSTSYLANTGYGSAGYPVWLLPPYATWG